MIFTNLKVSEHGPNKHLNCLPSLTWAQVIGLGLLETGLSSLPFQVNLAGTIGLSFFGIWLGSWRHWGGAVLGLHWSFDLPLP